MKKNYEIEFEMLLRDEEFIKLARETLSSKELLHQLFAKYTGKEDAVLAAVEFIRINLSDKKDLSPEDFSVIWENINTYLKSKKNTGIHRFVHHQFWKAAIIVIALTSVSLLTYNHFVKKDVLSSIAQNEVKSEDEAMIILSDGSKHKLETKYSHIEYSTDGGEILVKNGDQQEEKLENSSKSIESAINQIVVPYGHRHSVTLSDGTRVQLNSGSKLVFPAEFLGKTREVFLKGEGYFEVTKNPKQPFIVKTDLLDVKVLGTTFNISAYKEDQTVTTVLVEGRVNVYRRNKLFNDVGCELSPGQGFFFSVENSNSVVRKVDLADYISWKDGLYQFKDQPLKNITERVKKYYNASISIEGEELANTVISGKLVLTDNMEMVMTYLAKTLEVKYEIMEENSYLLKYK